MAGDGDGSLGSVVGLALTVGSVGGLLPTATRVVAPKLPWIGGWLSTAAGRAAGVLGAAATIGVDRAGTADGVTTGLAEGSTAATGS